MEEKRPFQKIREQILQDFQNQKVILSLDEYIDLVNESPLRAFRNSAQYLKAAFDYFGKEEVEESNGRPVYHFKLFDNLTDERGVHLVGQNRAQTELYHLLENFVAEGGANRLVLLHGPNGSSKSTFLSMLMRALELYSRTEEGALYTFSWIFPYEKKLTGGLGLGRERQNGGQDHGLTFAGLPEEMIAAKISSGMNDHPLLLFPQEYRKEFLEDCLRKHGLTIEDMGQNRIIQEGTLSPKNRAIFQELFKAHQGDLSKVFKHIQVERLYVSEKESRGAITIEPKMYIDASARQITMDQNLGALPSVLKSLNLYEMDGDLPKGNRGIVEYQDLLKRPIDTFRYLLNVCEESKFSVGSLLSDLDVLWVGSSNDTELDAFREYPDFSSFRARFELVRLPYLLKISEEKSIYDQRIESIAGQKEVAPHSSWVAALWAVLTRLKKPNPKLYPTELGYVISNLTPIEKARILDREQIPDNLSTEEQNYLRANLKMIRDEYRDVPYYEGRNGVSPREMIGVLYEAAQNPEHATLSPLAVIKAIQNLSQKKDQYEFLRQEPQGAYHQAEKFVEVVREEYTKVLEQEVRTSLGLVDEQQYLDFLKKYVHHVRHLLKNEQVRNPITGQFEDPDTNFINEFEKKIDIKDAEGFRQSVLSSIGSWALKHQKEKKTGDSEELAVNYREVFPEVLKKLENHYFAQQKQMLERMAKAVDYYGTKKEDGQNPDHAQLRETLENMEKRFGYSPEAAIEGISFLLKTKYSGS